MIYIIWTFVLSRGMENNFEEVYGPEGAWVRLFRSAEGFLGTELLKDLNDPLRYTTIDRWESVVDFEQFRSTHKEEYETLDHSCERLTSQERLIGVFKELPR